MLDRIRDLRSQPAVETEGGVALRCRRDPFHRMAVMIESDPCHSAHQCRPNPRSPAFGADEQVLDIKSRHCFISGVFEVIGCETNRQPMPISAAVGPGKEHTGIRRVRKESLPKPVLVGGNTRQRLAELSRPTNERKQDRDICRNGIANRDPIVGRACGHGKIITPCQTRRQWLARRCCSNR